MVMTGLLLGSRVQAVGPTSCQALCQAQPLVALRVMLRKAIS
jgi:hypothetical protein